MIKVLVNTFSRRITEWGQNPWTEDRSIVIRLYSRQETEQVEETFNTLVYNLFGGLDMTSHLCQGSRNILCEGKENAG